MCSRFISFISESLKDNLSESFNSAHFFSVLSDGSTDSGVIEQEAIYVRYLGNGCTQTKFAGIKPPIDVLKSLSAQHLLKKMNT